jgi:serine/threonine-protein kinase
LALPKKIGRFEIVGELNRGPWSVEYRATDPATGRDVALKVPSGETNDSPVLLARFYREARAAGALQHPNIVRVYDLGVDRGAPYIAMELLEGENLEQIVEREKKEGGQGPESAAVLLNYMVQVCTGLAFAHQNGVLHRDVRPANIFVTTRGIAKLTDFAQARLPHAVTRSSGMLAGDVGYASPEQISGAQVDGASDIWAVGCTLYEILTYTKPFQGSTMKEWMLSILSHEPTPFREMRPDLPPELDKVITKALKKDRPSRYREMGILVEDLERVFRKMMMGESATP